MRLTLTCSSRCCKVITPVSAIAMIFYDLSFFTAQLTSDYEPLNQAADYTDDSGAHLESATVLLFEGALTWYFDTLWGEGKFLKNRAMIFSWYDLVIWLIRVNIIVDDKNDKNDKIF